MTYPFGETVTHIARTPTTGGDGNDAFTNADPVDIPNVPVAPRVSNENVAGRDTVTVGLTVYIPAGVTVTPVDRFNVRGLLYEVVGLPVSLVSPFTGWAPGTPVDLARWTG